MTVPTLPEKPPKIPLLMVPISEKILKLILLLLGLGIALV
jgi:hypothetical protein